jgi:hypothetical protein
MNLVVKFNLLKNTQPHYSYTPESCLENDNYKLYFDRTVLNACFFLQKKNINFGNLGNFVTVGDNFIS